MLTPSFTPNTQVYIAGLDGSETVSTSEIAFFDTSNPTVAHLKIPLMHVGPNAKGLYWTPEVLEKIAPMFSSTTFKYDIGGSEGSSHVPEKLYSPHYDVGWTSQSYYDKKSNTLWVEGDVTYPDVIAKLQRMTTDGKRELNYASMGVLIDPDSVICSICKQKMSDCGHKRNETYNGQIAYAVPIDVQKALHVALTNAPADTEAAIADVIFQEIRTLRGENMVNQVGDSDSYTNVGSRPNTLKTRQVQPQQTLPIESFQKDQAHESMMTANPTDQKAKSNDAVGAMQAEDMPVAPSSEPTGMAGGEDVAELVDVIKALIMEVKSLREEVDGIKGTAGPAAPAAPEAPAPAMAESAPMMPSGPSKELADIAGKYHKKLLREVADKSVALGKFSNSKEASAYFQDMNVSQLETLSVGFEGVKPAKQHVIETANMPEYGAPTQVPKNSVKTFQDMSAEERRVNFGEYERWDNCFRNHAAVPGSR